MNTTSEATVNERQTKYDAVVEMANAAQVCGGRHACARRDHVMTEWWNGIREYKFEVRIPYTADDCGDEWETVFGGATRQECDAYISTSDLQNAEIVENGVCAVCDMYEARKEAVAKGKMLPFLIVVTGTSRHYGGPEEGGWWYDRDEVLEVRRAFTFEQGLRHARELREEYPAPRYNRFSCANRGEPDVHIRCVYGENDPRFPQDSPPGRPRYE